MDQLGGGFFNGGGAQIAPIFPNTEKDRVSCLGVCVDGYALCTGSWDSYLKLWA